MGGFVNVGALVDGERPKSKKALKAAVLSDIENGTETVGFDQTAHIHDGAIPGIAVVKDLPEGITLVVTGPDPYASRRWYGNVKVKDGKVVVS